MENQNEAPVAPEAQLAARIAALKSLQPGDIIVSETMPGQVYTGIVTDASGYPMIRMSCLILTFHGKVSGIEIAPLAHVDNLANWPGLRIHRATEGVL